MDRGEHLLRHVAALHGVHLHDEGLLVELLVLHLRGDAPLAHAVGHLHDVADAGVVGGPEIDLDVVKTVQNGDIAGGELELIGRYLVPILGVPLHEAHGQGVDNDAVVHLDDQVRRVEELGGLLHEEVRGEGHKAHRALQGPVRILGQKVIDGVRRGKVLLTAAFAALIGPAFPGEPDLIGDGLALQILDGLADDIFVCTAVGAHCHGLPPVNWPAPRGPRDDPSHPPDARSPAWSAVRRHPAGGP